MILAQKIVREDGVLLCGKGAELTEPLMRVLTRMNFETIPIEVTSTETPEEREARISKAAKEINFRFALVAKDPVLARLRKALLKRLQEED